MVSGVRYFGGASGVDREARGVRRGAEKGARAPERRHRHPTKKSQRRAFGQQPMRPGAHGEHAASGEGAPESMGERICTPVSLSLGRPPSERARGDASEWGGIPPASAPGFFGGKPGRARLGSGGSTRPPESCSVLGERPVSPSSAGVSFEMEKGAEQADKRRAAAPARSAPGLRHTQGAPACAANGERNSRSAPWRRIIFGPFRPGIRRSEEPRRDRYR